MLQQFHVLTHELLSCHNDLRLGAASLPLVLIPLIQLHLFIVIVCEV